MGRVPARSRSDAERSRTDSRWFLSGLLAWLFVGVSLGQLGVALIEALTVVPGLPRTTALLVVLGATVGVALLARDFEPSLLAAVAFYFIAEFFYVASMLIGRSSVLSGSTLTPWEAVGFRAFAIGLAVLLVFAGAGLQAVRWLQARLRELLEVPPREPERDDEE